MKTKILATACAAVAAMTLSGCLHYPSTETTAGLDSSRISFAPFAQMDQARVLVDGIDNGFAGQYKVGDKALNVLPGTHVITVVYPDGRKSVRKIYVDDGVTTKLTGF